VSNAKGYWHFTVFSIGLLALLTLMLGGCALNTNINSNRDFVRTSTVIDKIESNMLDDDLRAADAEIEPEKHSAVPLEINENVQEWINYFSIKDRERFRSFLERGLYYKDLVKKILKENGVPREIYYLAMIESGYITHARSRQNAVGAWQFMHSTGKAYGLRSDRNYLDERRDIIRSTKAAAKYLTRLHNEFGSWYLALAAYNAGEGRIRGAIKKGKSRDFWYLVNMKALPRETMNYVPKFLAAVIIGRNPEKYGFKDLTASQFPEIGSAKVPKLVHLKEIGLRTGISYRELQALNPHLLRGITPDFASHYEIWAPKNKVEQIKNASGDYTRTIPLAHRKYASKINRNEYLGYIVRRGDTLISIARKNKTSVRNIKKINGLKSELIYFGQRLSLNSKI